MKFPAIWLAGFALFLATNIALARGTVHVRAYYRKDGTYVHSYDRSAPGTSSGAGVYTPETSGSIGTSYTPDTSSSTRFVAAPNPSLDPNRVPAKIVSGQYVPGHYKSAEVSPSSVAASPSGATSVAPISKVPHAASFNSSYWAGPSYHRRELALLKSTPPKTHSYRAPVSQSAKRSSYVDPSGTRYLSSQGYAALYHRASAVSGTGERDSHGHIKRSEAAKHEFMRMTGYPHGRPGYVVDHIVPLKRGGADDPSNMQWQTIQEAKAKDKWE